MGKKKNKQTQKPGKLLIRLTSCLCGFNLQRWDANRFWQFASKCNHSNNDKQFEVFSYETLKIFYSPNKNSRLLAKAVKKCGLPITTDPSFNSMSVKIHLQDTDRNKVEAFLNTDHFLKKYFRARNEVPLQGQVWVLVLDIKNKKKPVVIPVFNETAQLLGRSDSSYDVLSKILVLSLGLVFSGFSIRYCKYTDEARIARVKEGLQELKNIKEQEKILQKQVLQEVGFGFF